MNGQPPGSLNVVALDPRGLQSLLAKAPFQWWVAGGWALDLFTGESWRPHYDLDVAIARRDQGLAQQFLQGWDFQYAAPGTGGPVVFKPWNAGQALGFEITEVGRERAVIRLGRFEFLMHEIEQGVWSFRYHPEVRHPVQRIGGRTAEGIFYLQPEIALLYKAVRLRHVNEQDFHRVLPHVTNEQRAQLAADIVRFSPEHSWLTFLSTAG